MWEKRRPERRKPQPYDRTGTGKPASGLAGRPEQGGQ